MPIEVIAMPYPPQSFQTSVGDYNYLVFYEGGVYKVVNNKGNVVYINTSPGEAIQYAIDNAPVRGTVVVLGDVTLDKTLVINKALRFKFDRFYSAQNPVIQVGVAGYYLETLNIEGHSIIGTGDKTNDGILFVECRLSFIKLNKLSNFNRGIHINPPPNCGVAENIFHIKIIDNCNSAIEFANTTNYMEGNVFYSTIFKCYYGFRTYSDSDAILNMFVGVIDNIEISGSYDIYDERGKNMFIMYFVRQDNSIIGPGSILINQGASNIIVGSPQSGQYGILIRPESLELWKPAGPILDFKCDPSIDYDWRLAIGSNNDFYFARAGVIPLTLKGDTYAVRINRCVYSPSAPSISAGGTYIVPTGFYNVILGANTVCEIYNSYTGSWVTFMAAGDRGVVLSDGTNVRLRNTGTASETSYLFRAV